MLKRILLITISSIILLVGFVLSFNTSPEETFRLALGCTLLSYWSYRGIPKLWQ